MISRICSPIDGYLTLLDYLAIYMSICSADFAIQITIRGGGSIVPTVAIDGIIIFNDWQSIRCQQLLVNEQAVQ